MQSGHVECIVRLELKTVLKSAKKPRHYWIFPVLALFYFCPKNQERQWLTMRVVRTILQKWLDKRFKHRSCEQVMTRWNDLFFNKIHANMVICKMLCGNISSPTLVNLVLKAVIDGKNQCVFSPSLIWMLKFGIILITNIDKEMMWFICC